MSKPYKHSKHKSKGNISTIVVKNKYKSKAKKNQSPTTKKVKMKRQNEFKKYNKAYNLLGNRHDMKNKYESYRYKMKN